ncbi:MAG: thioredoxin family protein [Actinomycetota bacterium]|nr:thioredoxin family protein [Actinomycetota bacterium]
MVEATKDSFHDLVSDGVTLVDVWGPACAPCIALMPDVERIEAERSVKVVKVEAPKNRRLCMELRVMGLPAFLLFRDGEEVSRLDGNLSAAGLWEWVDGNLAATPADGR